MSDYPDANDYYVDLSRVFVGQNSHAAIVLHATAGPATWTAQQLGDYFRTSPAETSSHFGIDRAGVVCQYVSLADGAAANCCREAGYDPFWDQFGGDNLNVHTIAIEHINDENNSLPLTDAQQAASFKLIAWLCNTYGLTVAQIKTHASIAPDSRAHCPGAAYPLDALKAFLQGGNTVQSYGPNAPDFTTWFIANDDTHWKCKETGYMLQFGNLELFRSLSIDGTTLPVIGLPRTNEIYQHETDGYGWSVQFFERGVLCYDPAHRKDSQPGLGDCYLGKYSQFMLLDPDYQAGIKVALPREIAASVAKVGEDVQALLAIAKKYSSLV